MGRSDDSDDSIEYRKSKKKSKKRSRSKSRGKKSSRDKRSRSRDRRSRSRDRSRRSRSREKRSRDRRSRSRDRRRSRSRDRRSRSRDRRSRSRDRRSRSRDRRSKSRSRRSRSRGGRRSRTRSRDRSRRKNESSSASPSESSEKDKADDIKITIAEELKRSKAIAEIDSDNFAPKHFRTDHTAKLMAKARKGDSEDDDDGPTFEFGTSAEVGSKAEQKETTPVDSSELIRELQEDVDDIGGDAGKIPETADEKRRRITELAANWEGRLEESRRKHAALAMIIEAKEEEKMRKAELTQKKWKRAGLDASQTIGTAMRAKLAAEEAANRIAAELMRGGGGGKTSQSRGEDSAAKNGGKKLVNIDSLDTRTKELYTHSKLLNKTKQKLKEQKRMPGQEADDDEAGLTAASAVGDGNEPKPTEEKAAPTEQTGIIGSIEEYASLVGKTVHQLAEARYEPPEVSESSDNNSEEDEAGDDLWGAIMGK